jgi:multiple sugar transport system ATP-binding protein
MGGLAIEKLTKVYSGPDGRAVRAVNEASFELEKGQMLVLLGPSGCGKTTTLRLIAGLETPSDGFIRLDGQVVNSLPPKERDIAMVFQSHALYPHMTAYENMAFGLKLRRFPATEIQERVREMAGLLELSDCLERLPRELSGGQRQRVALGRALVRRPAAFLLDEPLVHLDAPMRAQLRREIARLQQRLSITMVYVTHDQAEAASLGGQIALMKDGGIEQVGDFRALYERPASQFVAGFL